MISENGLNYYLWANNITQRDFARRIGVTFGSIGKIKLRKGNPSLFTALKIYLESSGKVSLLELLKEEEKNYIEERYKDLLELPIHMDDKAV